MLKVESYKKGIILSTFFNILNKGLVFLNGIVVAYLFGINTSTDIFFYINNSILILGVFFTSLNNTVIIPESMRIRTESGELKAITFLNFFIYTYLGLLILAFAIISIDPVRFFSLVSKFNEADLRNNLSLLYLSLPLFVLIAVVNLMIDVLASHKYFTIPMIVGVVNGLFTILFIVIAHRMLDINSIFTGLLISYGFNLVFLISIMKKKLNWDFGLVSVITEKRIWKNFGFAQLGNVTSTLASYTPMYILSGFSVGIITALTFAQQISFLPTMLITYQFSAVAGIKFNELYAQKKFKDISEVFSRTANFLHFLMIPAAFFLFQFADEIARILLDLTSMKNNSLYYLSTFLKYLAFLLPLMVINTLMARLFMASHQIKQSFWYQIAFNITLIVLLYFGVKNFGVIGYPAAMVSTYILNLVSCHFLEKKYFNFINYPAIISELLKLVTVNMGVSLLVFYLFRVVRIPNVILYTSVAGFVYVLLLAAVTKTLKMDEAISGEFRNILKKT